MSYVEDGGGEDLAFRGRAGSPIGGLIDRRHVLRLLGVGAATAAAGVFGHEWFPHWRLPNRREPGRSIDPRGMSEYPVPSALRGDHSAIHHTSIWVGGDELIAGWVGPDREVRRARRLGCDDFEDSVNLSAATGTVFGSPWLRYFDIDAQTETLIRSRSVSSRPMVVRRFLSSGRSDHG